MKYMRNFVTNASWFSLGISVAVVLLFGAIMVQSASTISTNISTGGTLSVTGASTLTGDVTAAGAVWASSTLQVTGAVTNYSTLLQTGVFSASSTALITGDVTMYGGSGALNLVTTNAATSTATIGCIQTYATSTATPIRMALHASSTAGASVGTGAVDGFVVWEYGSCPA